MSGKTSAWAGPFLFRSAGVLLTVLLAGSWPTGDVRPLRGEMLSMRVEIKSINLPFFRTGETGVLWGRVVLRLAKDASGPVKGSACLQIEKQGKPQSGAERTLYPGLYAALDFPVALEKPFAEDDFLTGRVQVKLDGGLELSYPAFVFVRRSGVFLRTYRSGLDDTVYPYALYLPEGVDKRAGGWPLVVSLHGAYSNHALNLRRLMGLGNCPGEPDELSLCSLPIFPELPAMPGIVVCPWGRGTMGYHGPGARDVLDVLDLVRENYPVDPERITVTGLSMGGEGTWEMALRHPDIFAAAVPVCAPAIREAPSTLTAMMPDPRKPLSFLAQSLKRSQLVNLVENGRSLSIHIHHGNDDPAVPVSNSVQMVAAFKKIGIEVPFTRYDKVGHNSWDPAYKDGETLRWLLSRHRAKPLTEISFATCRYENSRFDWVEIERFQNYGELARVKASWDRDQGVLALQTVNVSRLNLYLQALPGVAPRSKVRLVAGGSSKSVEVVVPEKGPLSVELSKTGRIAAAPAGPLREKGRVKRRGCEGPIFEAFSDRVLLVYGTGRGGPSTLDQLARFADWGVLPDVHFMIKPDTLVTSEDILKCHLVLFGDDRSNLIIGRINDRAPVRFQGGEVVAGAERFQKDKVALKCVFPNPLNPDRLVLLDFNEDWDYAGFWAFRSVFKLLPDYFIYTRGGGEGSSGSKILKAGYFTADWQWGKDL